MEIEQEESEVVEGQVAEATAEATPAATEELGGVEAGAIKPVPEDSQDAETKAPTPPNLDEEVMFEVGGKSYTMKQSQIVEALEKANGFVERERTLSEREKSMNKDYSQKSQANSQFRKSVETTFGRFPEQEELKALGKIWKNYFSNPQAKQLIDQVITGQLTAGNGSVQGNKDPYVQSLEQKIAQLEDRHNSFASSIDEREQMARTQESQKLWSTWVKSKDTQGIKITEEVDAKMAPFVSALRQAQPDMTHEQILDEAYKHATIDQLKQDAAKQTLVSADKAKKQGIIRVTPKGGQASDSSKSYKQMLMETA